MCNRCQHVIYLQQQWKIDPKGKEAWEGLRIDGRTITALCFGVRSIITKPCEENNE
jgi:hypothetical protein